MEGQTPAKEEQQTNQQTKTDEKPKVQVLDPAVVDPLLTSFNSKKGY